MSSSYDYDFDAPTFADGFAADAAQEARIAFIRRTYAHLFGAILAFIGLIALFMVTPPIRNFMLGIVANGYWWVAFLAFMGVSFLAERWATNDTSPGMQYFGLALYTAAEALIFVPLLLIAQMVGGEQLIPTAGFLTLMIFGGLTAVVFITKQDFSFLRMALTLGSMVVLGIILVSFFINLSVNFYLFLVIGIIVLMSGYILYHTSNVLHHYRTDQHVAASLALFASIATLFWYVIQLLMILGGED